MFEALGVVTLFLVLATCLPLLPIGHWSVRGFDFPRLQFAAIATLLLILQAYFLSFASIASWLMVTATLGCLLWQLWWVLPYTPVWRKEVHSCQSQDSDNSLSILVSNVLMTNRNSKALLALIHEHNPDVVITLESDQWWQDQLDVLLAQRPHSIKCPLDNLYGMHVYSRLAIENSEIRYLVEDDVPSIHGDLVLRSGNKVRVHFLHPAPPSPTENSHSTPRDAELLVVARRVAEQSIPTLITGDLNDVAWSRTTRLFRKVSGLLDPRIGRGLFNTFHADYPLVRWPLDHLFHSRHFTLNEIRPLPNIGSDHFPLYASLTFSPQQGRQQQGINADAQDKQQAQEIAAQKPVTKEDVL